MLAAKALLVVYGAAAFTVLQNQWPGGWLEIWNRWDAPHYLDIARQGYVSTGEESRWIVFYPLYPWLVRVAAFVLRDYLLSAFLVSALASVAAALLLQRLAALDEDERTARAAVFFMLAFPTAYFLHVGYTESLFMALALGSFLAARRRAWHVAGILGALAALTRVNGLLLIPALAAEAYARVPRRRADGSRARSGHGSRSSASGFIVYLALNEYALGDPFAFLEHTEGALVPFLHVAVGERRRRVALGAAARALGRRDGRLDGTALRAARPRLHDLVRLPLARLLRRLDGRQLAPLDEHEVSLERAALHADNVPRLHPVRARGNQTARTRRRHRPLVAAPPRALRRAVRPRPLGVLKKTMNAECMNDE